MTILIACLSTGKGTWVALNRLASAEKWERIYLITDSFGKEKFQLKDGMEFVLVDFRKGIAELRDEIKKILEGKIKETEVALNLLSGSGKEHMAILSALLHIGVGVRLVNFSDEKKELEIL